MTKTCFPELTIEKPALQFDSYKHQLLLLWLSILYGNLIQIIKLFVILPIDNDQPWSIEF